MTKNNSKTKQVFGGIFTMLAIWIIGILFSGEWSTADVFSFGILPDGVTKLLLTLYPFILIIAVTVIGMKCAKDNRKAFFITSLVCTLLPLISLGLGHLLNGTPLVLPFIFLYSPIATLQNFPMGNSTASAVLFTLLAVSGGIAGYIAIKTVKTKTE